MCPYTHILLFINTPRSRSQGRDLEVTLFDKIILVAVQENVASRSVHLSIIVLSDHTRFYPPISESLSPSVVPPKRISGSGIAVPCVSVRNPCDEVGITINCAGWRRSGCQ